MDISNSLPGELHSGLSHKGQGLRVAAAAIISIFLSLTVVSPVSATDPDIPSPFAIGTPKVFHHIFETDDFLLAFPYEITYSTNQPATAASLLFTYRLMSADGATTLGSAVPYAYNNSGYGQGMVAIYFSDATAPTWGGSYIIRIDGNPLYWTTPPSVTHTLSTPEYSTSTTQSGNRTALAAYIMDEASMLEINWGVKLYDTNSSGGIALTSTGQTYFTTVIPGLGTACPSIMYVASSSPEFTATDNPGTAAANSWQNQWSGTVIETWGNNIGSHLGGLNWQGITAGGLFIIIVLLAGFSQVKWGTTDPGYLSAGIILIIGAFAGWIWYAIMGVVLLVFLWYISHTQFWRNL